MTKHRSVVLFVNDVVSELHPRVYSVFKVVPCEHVRNLSLLSSKFVESFYRRPHNHTTMEMSGSAMPLLHLLHVCQLFESIIEAVASCVSVSSAVAGRSVCARAGSTVNNELCVRLL